MNMSARIAWRVLLCCSTAASLHYAAQALPELPPEAYKITPTPDAAAPFRVYVPKDLDDAFVELKKMLSPLLVEDMKHRPQADMILHHHGLGTRIRNNWVLWAGSRLSEHFSAQGITHPEDMSGIILDSFWRHLNGRPLDLEGQVACYRAYWDKLSWQSREWSSARKTAPRSRSSSRQRESARARFWRSSQKSPG